MIVGLLIGKAKSMGCPGKNIRNVLGHPMCYYGFQALHKCKYVDQIFTSTDSPEIAKVGKEFGAKWIERPAELATPEVLTEHVLVHAYEEMKERCDDEIEMVILAFANAPAVDYWLMNSGVEILDNDPSLDSAFSVVRYDMFSPLRARRIDEESIIHPYTPLDTIGDESAMSSLRGSDGGCYFCDLSVQVCRSRCFENIWEGDLPFRWQGKKSMALETDFGFDIDYEWQIPVVEHWLKTHGFGEKE